jgi:hypothetical protein
MVEAVTPLVNETASISAPGPAANHYCALGEVEWQEVKPGVHAKVVFESTTGRCCSGSMQARCLSPIRMTNGSKLMSSRASSLMAKD